MGFSFLSSACVVGVLALAAACRGQACSPFWASIPVPQPRNQSVWIVYDDGSGPTVYAGIGFQQISYFRWRHRQWEPITTVGLPPDRMASYGLAVLDDGQGPALYILLQFDGGASAPFRYRNGAWEPMPLAFWQHTTSSDYKPMCSADLGDGTHIYGQLPGGRVCRWNGATWDQIGQVAGSSRTIYTAIQYDDSGGPALYLFGQFVTIDGVVANEFARWNGRDWTGPWPAGMASYSGSPLVRVWDDGSGPKLYSNFMPALNGMNYAGLHRWDGHTWEFLGGPNTQIPTFDGLYAFDDGTGPGLYMSGEFSNFAGLNARNIVRYDRNGFHTVPGSDAFISALGFGVIRDERGESMVFNGGFTLTQTGLPVFRMAQLVGCHTPACPADCDANGQLNVNDFVCFINTIAAADPFGNAYPDNAFNVQDFVAFLNRFAAGCP